MVFTRKQWGFHGRLLLVSGRVDGKIAYKWSVTILENAEERTRTELTGRPDESKVDEMIFI